MSDKTRRRTLANNLLTQQKKHLLVDSQRHGSETTSDVITKSNHLHKLENTYQLQPSDSEKFEAHRVEQQVKEILDRRLEGVEYDRDSSTALAKDLANEIHAKVKEFQWRRYRLVCHVTVGQYSGQGIQVASRCVWDAKLDNYACVRYTNKSLFAVAQCYGVYFE